MKTRSSVSRCSCRRAAAWHGGMASWHGGTHVAHAADEGHEHAAHARADGQQNEHEHNATRARAHARSHSRMHALTHSHTHMHCHTAPLPHRTALHCIALHRIAFLPSFLPSFISSSLLYFLPSFRPSPPPPPPPPPPPAPCAASRRAPLAADACPRARQGDRRRRQGPPGRGDGIHVQTVRQ